MNDPLPLARVVPDCPAEPLETRLLYCAGLLHVWGILTDAERQRIQQRLLKAKAKREAKP